MADTKFAIQMVMILIAVVILIVLITQYNKNKKAPVASEERSLRNARMENYEEPVAGGPSAVMPRAVPSTAVNTKVAASAAGAINDVRPSESLGNEDYKAVDFATENKSSNECFPRDRNTIDDLLPKDAANSVWAQVNPAGQGDVKDQNFLNAGTHIGMNTVGQTLRNANLQLRSEPPNVKMQVSPWNQSTIEYDSSRRQFEVGDC